MMLKHCSGCNQDLPADTVNFHRHKRMKDGLSSRCKTCHNNAVIIYKSNNAEKVKQWRKDRYWSDPEKYRADAMQYYRDNIEYVLESIKEWQQANSEKVKGYKKRSDEKFRLQKNERSRILWQVDANFRIAHSARVKRWAKNNPEKVSLIRRRRHSRLRGASGSHTSEDIEIIYASQRGKCWWCEVELGSKFEIDHRIPISRDGSNEAGNLCLTCVHCNRSKYNKMPWEWSDRLL